MIWDTVASQQNIDVSAVRLNKNEWSNCSRVDLLKMGFLETASDYRRLTLASLLTRDEVVSEAGRQFPSDMEPFGIKGDHELRRVCSPVVLRDRDEAAFIVPIKPGYALSLFDQKHASSDLFGGRSKVLMRPDNVYFRKKTHHHMLQAPARILWYQSANVGAITACSHLDAVSIGTSKDLFRNFQELGTLIWREIFQMCDGDVGKSLMALQFSHTFQFARRIPLQTLRSMTGSKWGSLQSPTRVPMDLFLEIVEFGFEGGEA